MHALGKARRFGAPVQLHRVAAGISALQVVEHFPRVTGCGLVEHADDLRHGLVLLGQRLKDEGDVAGQVVRSGQRPKRVGLVVFARAQRAGDGDDVLLDGQAAAPANVVKRVVPDGATHVGEVDLVDFVTLFAQVGGHFAIQRALGVKHDVRALRLQQVRLEVVARCTCARAAQHEHVVVQARFPRVGACRVVGGQQHAALVGVAGGGDGGGGEGGGVRHEVLLCG